MHGVTFEASLIIVFLLTICLLLFYVSQPAKAFKKVANWIENKELENKAKTKQFWEERQSDFRFLANICDIEKKLPFKYGQ
jgi:hypothetical protein